jgi:DNA-binding NarL/FixJ family response regulator
MAISILIVDNDNVTRDILTGLVAHGLPNVIIHVTATFESALELCINLQVDIVVTATSMPPKKSDDMLDAIRNIEYDPIKIIVMTTSSPGNVPIKLTAANTSIISKPVNIEELITLIKCKIALIEAGRSDQFD